jgi:hypothetical protein
MQDKHRDQEPTERDAQERQTSRQRRLPQLRNLSFPYRESITALSSRDFPQSLHIFLRLAEAASMRLIIRSVAQRSRIRVQATHRYSDNCRRDGNHELDANITRVRFDSSEQSTVLSLIPIYESNCSFDRKQLHIQTGSR